MLQHISFIRLKSTPSTLTYAAQHYLEFDREAITCISAEEQTAGRGRFFSKVALTKRESISHSLFHSQKK